MRLHCACAVLDKAAVSLLLEHGASPLDSNAEGMTPQDIVYQSSEGQDAEAAKVIAAILCASCDRMQVNNWSLKATGWKQSSDGI